MKTRNTFSGNYNKPFPVALRNLMQSTAKTQKEVSKAIGKTTQSVSQYMNGQSEPGYETLVKIADFFDCSVDYLLGRTNDPSMSPRATDKLALSVKTVDLLTSLASMYYNGILVDKAKGIYRAYALETTLDALLRYPRIIEVLYQFSRYNAYAHYFEELRKKEAEALSNLDPAISNKIYDAKLQRADAKNNLQEELFNILHYLEDGEAQQWRDFQYEDK